MTKVNGIGPIRIFVASPGDVQFERECLPGVINELNRTLGALLPASNIRLDLLRWESHAFPAMGRPQQVINEQVGDYDIFIGILWKRFGSPTGKSDSGTEEEFRLAYENWKSHGRPHILFYFNRALFSMPKSRVDVDQMGKVVHFREELESQGLVWEYSEAKQFPDVVRPHLTEVVGKLLSASQMQTTSRTVDAERVPARRPRKSLSPIGARIRITALGKDDGFYDSKDEYIGLKGTLIEATKDGEWTMGKVKLDRGLYAGDDGIYPFYRLKYKILDAET